MQPDHKCSELVLIGGGHSHVQVLKSLAMDPVAGLRTTVISRDVMTPYSGMLPGYVAGHYDWRDIHIDLAPLAAAAGARLIEDQVEGLDPEAQRIMTAGRPPIRYDLLSINSGSAPALDHIVDADRFGIPVKPINQFVPKWQALLRRLCEFEGERFRLAIVGGGAGGVELALAIRYRLEVIEQIGAVEILLISAADRLLLGHNDGVRERMRKLLSDRRLDVHLSARVTSVREGLLETDVDGSIPVDEVLWVTQAAPQAWPAAAGLAVDESGFVLVNDKLQSISHPNIFAAGDIATLENDPRPKAGVFAVRQAPVLAENLKRAATEQPLRAYKPQTQFLALISTGGRHAIASRGDLAAQGWWVWRWKNWLDRRFMERFVVKEMPNVKPRRHIEAMRADQRHDGRCGGSGAKLGADLLGRVLERIGVTSAPEDAAVLRPVVNGLELQTIDGFRAMLDDPYTVGRIAAEHAQNDVFAMGGLPRTAMAWVTVPFAAEALMEEDLYQVMCGAKDVFEKSGADIVGGHSGEGPELAVGFALSGTVHEDDVWNNHRIAIDDALILTKPIGTGVLLAAHGRARCRADWLKAALESMQHSNRAAMAMLRDAGVRACTDITGFGIVGHTVELARAAKLCVEIYPARVPCLMGAAEMMEDGIVSTLQESNERVLADVDAGSFDARHTQVRLLFDPQTSGGLVAAVRPQQAMACVAALREAGFTHVNVIGRVVERRDDGLLCALAEE